MTTANPLAEINRTAVDTASRLTRIQMDSAERVIALQLDYVKSAVEQATRAARALTGAKDVQELVSLRTRAAEGALEKLMGYSRGLYEVASEAQSEYSKLAEERMSSFQKAVVASVDQAARAVPPGGDVALQAVKSTLAATTAAFDTFNKAARHAASLADAGVKGAAAGPRSRK